MTEQDPTAEDAPISAEVPPPASRRRVAWAGPAGLVAVAMAVFASLSWAGPAPAEPRLSAPHAAAPHAAAPHAANPHSAKLRATHGTVAAGGSQGGQTRTTLPVSTNPADISQGETLFNEHCAACHGLGGVGAKGPELLNVGPAAADFFLATGRMPLASPFQEPQPHAPYFNPGQIADIVAYVNAIDVAHGTPGPGIPTVAAACAQATASCPTLSEGNELFIMNCAQCHDASGSGGLLSHGFVVPSLRSATPTQIAEAIRVGPRPMPNFGPGQLTDQQVSAIADYVHYLASTADPGGLGIAHFGPVPEGFVGIIFGLGVLILVARLIGNRG